MAEPWGCLNGKHGSSTGGRVGSTGRKVLTESADDTNFAMPLIGKCIGISHKKNGYGSNRSNLVQFNTTVYNTTNLVTSKKFS